jgi:hypothetical protein
MNAYDTSESRDERLGVVLIVAATLAALGLGVAGCSGRQTAAPVDAPRAREALRVTLERENAFQPATPAARPGGDKKP